MTLLSHQHHDFSAELSQPVKSQSQKDLAADGFLVFKMQVDD